MNDEGGVNDEGGERGDGGVKVGVDGGVPAVSSEIGEGLARDGCRVPSVASGRSHQGYKEQRVARWGERARGTQTSRGVNLVEPRVSD